MPSTPATIWSDLILVCSSGTERTTTSSGLIELITDGDPAGQQVGGDEEQREEAEQYSTDSTAKRHHQPRAGGRVPMINTRPVGQ